MSRDILEPTDLRGRVIPVAWAPMVYHLWAAWEKAENLPDPQRRNAQAQILTVLRSVTEE